MKNPFQAALLLFILFSFSPVSSEENKHPSKVLICGVCRNVEGYVENAIHSIEDLGKRFSDYAVIIYENNSTDNTVSLFQDWAKKNPKIVFLSENMHELDLPWTRTGKIARARNKVLSEARSAKYNDFEYLVMADLDFRCRWPIDEIVRSIDIQADWDCISANGIRSDRIYYDRYAFRDATFPLGPEILIDFWSELWSNQFWFELSGDDLIPVFSAFGGLAIYKTASILPFSYSGVPTSDLEQYYKQILAQLPQENRYLQKYLNLNHMKIFAEAAPFSFQIDSQYGNYQCCEHVPLHASMAIHGFGRFFINPKLCMLYHFD